MEDSKILLLEQKFESYKSQTDKELAELKRITENQEQRIIELERNNTKTDLQYDQIMKSLTKLNEVTIPNLTAQIEELKSKPAKRYDLVVTGIIAAVVSGVMGFVISNIFGGK